MRRLHKLARLSPGERAMVCAAIVWLPMAAAGVRLVGFRRTRELLLHIAAFRLRLRTSRGTTASRRDPGPRRVVALVQQVANASGLGARCLHSSLVSWFLLRCRGFEPALRLGILRLRPEFTAHAWLELDGRALENLPDSLVGFELPLAGQEGRRP